MDRPDNVTIPSSVFFARSHLKIQLTIETMTSIKCANCGLVNFSTEQNCKRCKSLLPHSGNAETTVDAFYAPPPPPVFRDDLVESAGAPSNAGYPCIKCGSRGRITVRNFVKIYHSPVAILGIFLGCLPYVLLKLLLRTKHDLSGPFCESCWSLYQQGQTLAVVNVALFVVIIIVAPIVAVLRDWSEWSLLFIAIGSLVVLAIGEKYLARYAPKYKRVTSREVVVDAPHIGEIVYTR